MRLTADIGLRGVILGIQRVEVLLKPRARSTRGWRWRREWAWSSRSSRSDLRCRVISQSEKPGTVPTRAGYGESDLGQAWIGLAVPGKPVREHHDPLRLTIPLARQQGARLQFGSGSVEVSREPVGLIGRPRPDPVKQAPTVGIQFPEPIGLQPISQNMKQ